MAKWVDLLASCICAVNVLYGYQKMLKESYVLLDEMSTYTLLIVNLYMAIDFYHRYRDRKDT